MARTKKQVEMSEDLENQELPEEEYEEVEEVEEEDLSEDEVEEVDEETEAAATLKPKSKDVPDPKSKLETMTKVIGHMASMSSKELTKWWDDTEKQVNTHYYGSKIPSGAASSNKHSIDAKPSDAVKESVKDDLKELFNADKTLNEEAKDRLETIFEAAVSARLMVEKEKLETEMEEQFEEAVTEVATEVEDKIDAYLNYCTEQFMEENEVAVDSSLRSELAEEFMNAFSNLCREYNINVPENKIDIVEALTAKVEEQDEILDAIIKENKALKDAYVQAELEAAIEEVAEGLTEQEAEKLMALCEDVDFDGDVEEFQNKVAIIRETYFKDGHYVPAEEDDLEKVQDDLNEEEEKEVAKANDPQMQMFADAISRTSTNNR
jgi:hypothetical protein